MLHKTLKNCIFPVIFIVLLFVGCGMQPHTENTEDILQTITQTTTQNQDTAFQVDFTKVSSLIEDNVGQDVVTAAKAVIQAFLQYENSVQITVSGNPQRFLNDMAYVIHCTCPLYGAFADLNEMSGYDPDTGTVSWQFYVEEALFREKVADFYRTAEEYLNAVEKTDSEAMRAMVLYYAIIDDLQYDYDLVGENYEKLSPAEADLRESPYYVLTKKSGICTNMAQAYLFLCTQADIACGTVLHRGGAMHMWNVVEIDGQYYYCDPTWDANGSLTHFGMTAADREDWAGGYSAQEGTMLGITVPETYDISNGRFAELRGKLPVEISKIRVDRALQTVTFEGYEYECVFDCGT